MNTLHTVGADVARQFSSFLSSHALGVTGCSLFYQSQLKTANAAKALKFHFTLVTGFKH